MTHRALVSATALNTLNDRLSDALELLEWWCETRQDAVGGYSTHYPIDNTLHGNRVADESEAWGCNACGHDWPCLVVLSQAVLLGDQ